MLVREDMNGVERALAWSDQPRDHHQHLGMRGEGLTDGHCLRVVTAVLAAVGQLALHSINLGHGVTPASFVEFAPIMRRTFGGLRTLKIDGGDLGDAGVAALAQALPATIRSLTIEHVRVGNAGVEALAPALVRTGIRRLSLRDNAEVHEAGWAALGVALPQLAELAELDVSRCPGMSVAALTACLAAHGNPAVTGKAAALKELHMYSCRLDQQAIQRLAAVLPQCPALEMVRVLLFPIEEPAGYRNTVANDVARPMLQDALGDRVAVG